MDIRVTYDPDRFRKGAPHPDWCDYMVPSFHGAGKFSCQGGVEEKKVPLDRADMVAHEGDRGYVRTEVDGEGWIECEEALYRESSDDPWTCEIDGEKIKIEEDNIRTIK